MKNLILVLALCATALLNAQINTQLLSQLSYQSELSDIWGYVDEDGNEYALVGKHNGVSVVDVSDPENPVEVYSVPGDNSIWRDLKVWGDYAYITNETGSGLMIIDLSPLPQSSDLTTINYEDGGWSSAHNLYIDENGICYIFGANRDNGGVIMYDLTQNPTDLVEVGKYEEWYVHDGMARGDTLYLGHINDGHFSVVDVSDKANPVLLGTKETSFNFTHNVWVSDDGDYLFTTDERSDAYLGAYDISDLNDIEEVDLYQSSDNGVIPHNVHYLDGFLVTSYYRDGLDITDVSRPHNMIRVGSYDTADDMEGNGFNGAWGAYPYLPSGNILVSDIEKGLFVIGFTYDKACFLEGRVYQEGTSIPINQVNVEVSDFSTNSNVSGEFYTGTPVAGNYDVTFSRLGYLPKTINIYLSNGELVDTTIHLELDTRFDMVLRVEDEEGQDISNAIIKVHSDVESFDLVSNDSAYAFLEDAFPADYFIQAGKWGYESICDSVYVDEVDSMLVLVLNSGYHDDFSLDLGWETSFTASSGAFVREEPNGTFDNGSSVQPGYDAFGDCLDIAYISGNADTEELAVDDIDDGQIVLRSPIMDLSQNDFTYLNYYTWVYLNSFGSVEPNDSLNIWVTNGEDSVLVESKTHMSLQRDWIFSSILLDDLIEVNENMRVHFIASDESPGHVFEVGVDLFSVTNEQMLSTERNELQADDLIDLYPNPISRSEVLNFSKLLTKVQVYSVNGQLVRESLNTSQISMNGLKAGMYTIIMLDESFQQVSKILLK